MIVEIKNLGRSSIPVLALVSVMSGASLAVSELETADAAPRHHAATAHRHNPDKQVSASEVRRDSVKLTLYYMPFTVETFTPTNPGNIRQRAPMKVIRNENGIVDLKRILQISQQPGKFQPDNTRLLVEEESGKVVYVDQNGGVPDGERQYTIEPIYYLELYLLLDRLVPQKHMTLHLSNGKTIHL